MVEQTVNSQFTAAVSGGTMNLLNSTKMLKSGQPAFHTHVSKWNISQNLREIFLFLKYFFHGTLLLALPVEQYHGCSRRLEVAPPLYNALYGINYYGTLYKHDRVEKPQIFSEGNGLEELQTASNVGLVWPFVLSHLHN